MEMDENMDLPCSIQTERLRNQHMLVIWREGIVSKHSCAKLYQGHRHIAVSPSVGGSVFQFMLI